jgi:hypothetical protein
MSTNSQGELASFHEFVAIKLSESSGDLSPEEVLELWREKHPPLDDSDDATAALREALNSIAAGDDGIPFDEFERDFRSRHGIDAPQ